jgi:chondroitin AC lyase
MLSERMINAELVNDEGTRSQHLSDGANLLYLDGDEYFDIFPVWDWEKIPGTTVEQTGTFERSEIRVKGRTNFVGGVSDGTFGLCAMDLSRGKLAARKAWAFFDDSYVALGAGIACDSDNPVLTSVNQCLRHGDVSEGARWLHHHNVGYVFADRSNVKFTAGPQEGRWSDIGTGSSDLVRREVFNCWIDHGVRPAGASYAYEVAPGATPAQTADRAAKSPARVIANTSDIQAVAHERLNVLAAAFYKPGKLAARDRAIEVDRPCLLLVEGTKLAVSDPRNQPGIVRITLNGKAIDVKLPDGDAAGSSAVTDVARAPRP